MTRRQAAMGISESELARLRKTGEYAVSMEAFAVAASTLKRGTYSADDVVKTFALKCAPWLGGLIDELHADDETRNKLRGLCIMYPDYYSYRYTHDMDRLTVR